MIQASRKATAGSCRRRQTCGTASAAKHDYLTSIGAVPTTYGEGLRDRVAALAPRGVAAALDIAGSGILPELVAITGDADKVVTISDMTAEDHGVRASFHEQDATPALAHAAALFDDGRFTLPVQRTFALDQVGAAHAVSQAGHVTGRLIVRVA